MFTLAEFNHDEGRILGRTLAPIICIGATILYFIWREWQKRKVPNGPRPPGWRGGTWPELTRGQPATGQSHAAFLSSLSDMAFEKLLQYVIFLIYRDEVGEHAEGEGLNLSTLAKVFAASELEEREMVLAILAAYRDAFGDERGILTLHSDLRSAIKRHGRIELVDLPQLRRGDLKPHKVRRW
jgi:hypothetical protein